MVIRTPDHRLRVFVSSTLKELAEERKTVRQAILRLRLAPVMFESGARPHPAQELYKAYLEQSHVFIGLYWQNYGWVAPEMSISGLEDEYLLSARTPRLIYIKSPAPARDPALSDLLDRIRNDNTSCYTYFSTSQELNELVQNDLALLLAEHFEALHTKGQPGFDSKQIPLTNVPVPRNALVDRGKELTVARTMLLRDDIALLTLTGPGGTGKSRLAIHIGLEMLTDFRDGIYMVPLESISDPNLVFSTIAEILGIRDTPGSRSLDDMLKEYLREKQMLLILDNFEQVVEFAPHVGELLEACPGLKILVTSRIPLHLRAENELPVPPLKVPSLENFSNIDSLSQYAAVELFIKRAQAIKLDFTITNASAPAVAEICYCLDGLPLAIELAAARIKLFTPQDILARLENRFDLLRGGTRDLPQRQRTLRSAIEWSFDLLGESEKKLFQRLSVFSGGWTLEAAEKVCNSEGDFTQNLFEVLESLIDNNLVIQYQESEESPRFGMLSTIHEYAREWLLKSEHADRIRLQHAKYYQNFVKEVEPLIRSHERLHWQRVMQREFGNVRGVLGWISETGKNVEIGQEIVITLGMYWIVCGYIVEGKRWSNLITELSDGSTPAAVHAGLLGVAGEISWLQGDYSSAEVSLDECLDLLNSQDELTSESKHTLASALMIRGLMAATSGDYTAAAGMYHRSLDLCKEIEDQWLEVITTSWLGDIAMYESDNVRAQALYNQSIELAREQGDPWVLSPSLMSSGQIAIVKGDLTSARSILTEAEDLLRMTKDNWSLSWVLNDMGHIMLMENHLDQAAAYFLEAINLAKVMGNLRAFVILLVGSAALVVNRLNTFHDDQNLDSPELTTAGRICGATESYIGIPGIFGWYDSKMLYDAYISQVRSSMDEDLWDQAYSEGQNMALEEAVELAVQSLSK